MQAANKILMVRPAAFGYNQQTAADNYFQHQINVPQSQVHEKALQQFDVMVNTLRLNGVSVIVVNDTEEPPKPDAIFPNNWFSAGSDGIVHVFPMCAPNRRPEKRDDILKNLQQNFQVKDVLDWSEFEAEAQYLEGTGSMVMDHLNKIIYACVSERTNRYLLEKFACSSGYRAMAFTAADENGNAIYHTNVMMSIGERFAIWCPKVIPDATERIAVSQLLEATGKENIYIEPKHMKAFAGNLLQVKSATGESLIVLSKTAYEALPAEKINRLQQHGRLLPIDVSIIEQVNGGSVRCMMAEVFLPPGAFVKRVK